MGYVERCKISNVIQIVATYTNNIRVHVSNEKYSAEFCNLIQMTRYHLIMQIFVRCTKIPVPKNIAQFVRWLLFCFDHFLSPVSPYYEMKTNTNNKRLIYARLTSLIWITSNWGPIHIANNALPRLSLVV